MLLLVLTENVFLGVMVIGQAYRLQELRGMRALERDKHLLNGQDGALLAFAGVGMGDGAAVDIAEESHGAVLQSGGSSREEEDMVYHHLFPIAESGYSEGVMIDDHEG